MGLLEEVVYDKRFEALSEEDRASTLANVRSELQKQYNVGEADLEKFNAGFDAKVKTYQQDMFLEPTEKQIASKNRYDMLQQAKLEKSIMPEKPEILTTRTYEDTQKQQQLNAEAEAQGLQYPWVSPEIAMVGGTHALKGALMKGLAKNPKLVKAGTEALIKGKGFALGSVAGDLSAYGAVNTAEHFMDEDFEREHPMLTLGIKLGAGLTGGMLGGITAESKYLMKNLSKLDLTNAQSYAKVSSQLMKRVQDGKISPSTAEAILAKHKFDPTKFLTKENFDADNYLKMTKPEKFMKLAPVDEPQSFMSRTMEKLDQSPLGGMVTGKQSLVPDGVPLGKTVKATLPYEVIPTNKEAGARHQFYQALAHSNKEKIAFTGEVTKVLNNTDGTSKLFELWGKKVKDDGNFIGAWEKVHNPLHIMTPEIRITNGVVDPMDSLMMKWVDSVQGKMLHQDGIGHYVMGGANTIDDVAVVDFQMGTKVTPKMFDMIEDTIGLAPVDSINNKAFQIVNFEGLPQNEFLAKIAKLEDILKPKDVTGHAVIDGHFAHTGNYDEVIEGVYNEISKRGGDSEKIRRGYEVLSTQVDEVFRKESAKFGLDWDEFVPKPKTKLTTSSAVGLREGTEDLAWAVNKSHTNEDVARALDFRRHNLDPWEQPPISKFDYSDTAKTQIANAMADEIEYEIKTSLKEGKPTGIGWYTKSFNEGIDKLAPYFPELGTDPQAKSVFTALTAITSDGAPVRNNLKHAVTLYDEFRRTGTIPIPTAGGKSAPQMRGNIDTLNKLIKMHPEDLGNWLEQTSDIKAIEKLLKTKFGRDMIIQYPESAKGANSFVFGTKIGSFYQNLSGVDGFLTKDRWWNRSFNRLRGQLRTTPSKQSVQTFTDELRKAGVIPDGMAEYVPVPKLKELAKKYTDIYAKSGFKAKTPLNKSAKNVYEAMTGLQDVPKGGGDRVFMDRTAEEVQKILRERGYKLSKADLQAVEWYFEKRLYKGMGTHAQLKDFSYGDVVDDVIREVNPNLDAKATTMYSQGAGLAVGAEVDEDGNIGFNPVKGLAGVAGVYLGGKALGKLYKSYTSGKLKGTALNKLHPETKFRLAQRLLQDKFNRVKTLINTKGNIDEIDDALNIYQKEELFHGRVATQTQEFLEQTASPLFKRIDMSGFRPDQVDEYLHARHAKERNAKMFELNGIENGSGMSNEEAVTILKKWAGNEKMEGIAQEVYAINRKRLQMIREAGLENDDFIRQLESGYENYVPLKRVFEEGASYSGPRVGKGFDIKGKEFKRAKGSHRQVESPLNHTLLDYQETIVRAEKNKVGQSLLKFIDEFPDKDIYEVAGLKHTPTYDSTGKLLSYNPKYKLADNVLHVKVGGKIKEVVIHDPALASAMKNLGADEMNSIFKYAHKAVRFLAGVNTQWNPAFTVSNFQRDIQTAFMNVPESVTVNRGRIFSDISGAMRGIYRKERGKSATEWSKLYQEMKKAGGTTGWLEQYDVASMSSKMAKLAGTKHGLTSVPRKSFDAVFDLIDDANTAVENSARLVAYKMAKDSGLSVEKSASIAKNLTVNFNRKGQWGSGLNTMYMFYNASVQGSVRLMEQMVSSPTTQKLATGLMASSVGLYYYNISQNKDAYEKIPDYIKDTNYIFMQEDGNYWTIRLPYGYNVIKSSGDVIAEYSNGDLDESRLAPRLATALANGFNPIGSAPTATQTITPTLMRPMVDVELNTNFMGTNIAPKINPYGPKSKPDSHNAFKGVNPKIDKFAKGLNEMTGGNRFESGLVDISPETIEHYLEFVVGGLGKLVNRTYTGIDKAVKGEEVPMNKIPFARQVFHEPYEKASLYGARDLFDESGVKRLSQKERNQFTKWIGESIKNKTIEPRKAMQMSRDFHSNQALLDFANKYNVQSYEQVRNDRKLMFEAMRMGIKESQLKNFFLKEK